MDSDEKRLSWQDQKPHATLMQLKKPTEYSPHYRAICGKILGGHLSVSKKKKKDLSKEAWRLTYTAISWGLYLML